MEWTRQTYHAGNQYQWPFWLRPHILWSGPDTHQTQGEGWDFRWQVWWWNQEIMTCRKMWKQQSLIRTLGGTRGCWFFVTVFIGSIIDNWWNSLCLSSWMMTVRRRWREAGGGVPPVVMVEVQIVILQRKAAGAEQTSTPPPFHHTSILLFYWPLRYQTEADAFILPPNGGFAISIYYGTESDKTSESAHQIYTYTSQDLF